jgi:CheY-like chemotaxis protein
MFRIDFGCLRFLIVDDNVHMRRIVRALLIGFGARDIHEAEDATAALHVVARCFPDIIITDWVLPSIDGLGLTRIIRQPDDSANPYVPIIMLTGHSEKRRVLMARDAGITEFLAKPVSAKSLYHRIFNVVARPRPFIKAAGYFGPDRRRSGQIVFAGRERRGRNQSETIAARFSAGRALEIRRTPLSDAQ